MTTSLSITGFLNFAHSNILKRTQRSKTVPIFILSWKDEEPPAHLDQLEIANLNH
jgi:hypothetical protein